MDMIKVEIKEESSFLDFCSQNQGEIFTKDPLKNVKVETITSDIVCDRDTKIKTEEEAVVSKLYSQNEREIYSEQHVMEFNRSINETETKIEIKEEHWWLDRNLKEAPCIYDGTKDGIQKDFYSMNSPSLYKDSISCCTPHLFSNEYLENDIINFNMRKGGPESESGRKCENKKRDVIGTSSRETNVRLETPDGGKTISMASGLKQNNLPQQHNANKEDINKENCRSILSCEHRQAFKCDICEMSFQYLSHLKSHRFFHESQEVKKCDVCDNDFNDLSSLKQHRLIHEVEIPQNCDLFNKAFVDLQYLQAHKFIHEGTKSHKCNICNKAFPYLSNLKSHKVIHEGIKPHQCNICKKAFACLQYLKSHELIHQETKPHKCNICKKVFGRLQYLQSHKLIHEGIKPYKCNICSKSFAHLHYLKTHKLIHEGIKPHKCNICDKSFADLSNLKRHKLIHEGIKPHKCNICDKAFADLSSVKRHKLLIHQKKNS